MLNVPMLCYTQKWKSSQCLVKQISCNQEGSRKIINIWVGLSAEEIRGAVSQCIKPKTILVQKFPFCLTLTFWEGLERGKGVRKGCFKTRQSRKLILPYKNVCSYNWGGDTERKQVWAWKDLHDRAMWAEFTARARRVWKQIPRVKQILACSLISDTMVSGSRQSQDLWTASFLEGWTDCFKMKQFWCHLCFLLSWRCCCARTIYHAHVFMSWGL